LWYDGHEFSGILEDFDGLGFLYSELSELQTGQGATILLHGPYIGSVYSFFLPSPSKTSSQSKHLNSIISGFIKDFIVLL
jgi:hypothetical protein